MVILIVFLSFSCFLSAEKIWSLTEEEKLKDIQKEIIQKRTLITKTKKQEQEALNKLYVIKSELNRTKEKLTHTQDRIYFNRKKIGHLNLELRSSQEELRNRQVLLNKRIENVYKGSHLSFLEVIFSSSSVSDFLNRVYFFGRVLDKDINLIRETANQYTLVESKKEELVDKTEKIKVLVKEIDDKKKIIENKHQEENQLYSSLKKRREEYERRLKELEASSNQLEKLIQAKIAARKKSKQAAPDGTGILAWPLRGRITSGFGYRRHPLWGGKSFHRGIDIAAPYGKSITAADGGEVILAGWWDGYGKAVVIDHGKSISTVYGHMSRIYVKNGQKIKKGQVVGLVGSTGYSTGPHLHFEVRKDGSPQNPLKWL